MNGRGKSDRSVVPGKQANNDRGALRSAEPVEERDLTKGNVGQQTKDRTQRRAALQNALDRVRQAVRKDKKQQLTALWHHVYNTDRLHEAYRTLNREAAAGVDGQTWKAYERTSEGNLQDLSERLKGGAYRAKPVLRTYVSKEDGRQRPIGIPTLEDKIVQRATTEVLNAVYEEDFLGFSYGFRPGRGQHNALDALVVGIETQKVNWVLDADIRGFFDAIDHDWMMRFVEHRIADQRVLRHIKKWLKAGVLEDEKLRRPEAGTPQGGSISPLLANIYLHYVFDLWIQQWRKREARGDVIVVRFADDFVVGFEHKEEAERFRRDLETRLQKFGLELHPEKTRLLEFGRYAAERRGRRGQGRPETFDFLGFTHMCWKKRNGRFAVRRKTLRKRMRRKLRELKDELRKRLHYDPHKVGAWLAQVLRGHYQYYGVPLNYEALERFQRIVGWLWYRSLRRRSQKTSLTWDKMRKRFLDRWLPSPRIHHPWPDERLRVTTCGRSPVR